MTAAVPHAHEHGHPDHVHDEACARAHGELPVPERSRHLVACFLSPVALELAELAGRCGWTVALLEPDPRRAGEVPDGLEQASSPRALRIDPTTDVVVCDHDRPELGDVLAQVLEHPARWVGVMGSLRHTAPHVQALRERGVSPEDVARVHRPIGLDVGAQAPAEIAVATLAGLLADRSGRSGGPFPAAPPAPVPAG